MCGFHSNTEYVDSDFRLLSQSQDHSSARAPAGAAPGQHLIDPNTLRAIQQSQGIQSGLSSPSAASATVGYVAPPSRVVLPPRGPAPSAPPDTAMCTTSSLEEQDRLHALRLQEQLDLEEAGALPARPPAVQPTPDSQEEADRRHALQLQEEFEREGASGAVTSQTSGAVVDAIGVDMSDEQLAAYQQAELDYFRQRDTQQQQGRRVADGASRQTTSSASSKSSCVVS